MCIATTNDRKPEEKIKIIKFLISEGIDINYTTKKEKRNALHCLNFGLYRPNPDYALEVTKLLVENGIDVNAFDKYHAIPLDYAITINKLPTEKLKILYCYLLEKGSKYDSKDVFGKSCLDYAKEYSWRNGFLDIVKEYENDK